MGGAPGSGSCARLGEAEAALFRGARAEDQGDGAQADAGDAEPSEKESRHAAEP